jgi:hypothetical protein
MTVKENKNKSQVKINLLLHKAKYKTPLRSKNL